MLLALPLPAAVEARFALAAQREDDGDTPEQIVALLERRPISVYRNKGVNFTETMLVMSAAHFRALHPIDKAPEHAKLHQ